MLFFSSSENGLKEILRKPQNHVCAWFFPLFRNHTIVKCHTFFTRKHTHSPNFKHIFLHNGLSVSFICASSTIWCSFYSEIDTSLSVSTQAFINFKIKNHRPIAEYVEKWKLYTNDTLNCIRRRAVRVREMRRVYVNACHKLFIHLYAEKLCKLLFLSFKITHENHLAVACLCSNFKCVSTNTTEHTVSFVCKWHQFFQSEMFVSGKRPAYNCALVSLIYSIQLKRNHEHFILIPSILEN